MPHTLLTSADQQDIAARGQSAEAVLAQLAMFQRGMLYTQLQRPCTVGDGIVVLQAHEIPALAARYAQAVADGRVTKFVPASGAATRMFHTLLAAYEPAGVTPSTRTPELQHFLDHVPQFAFHAALQDCLRAQGRDLATGLATGQDRELLAALLTPQGLNYANLPKALLHFHRYKDHCRTPLAEHFVEAATYAQDRRHIARLHVTVTAQHREAVQAHIASLAQQARDTGTQYEVTLSIQHPETDTLAVTPDNQPFRDEGGHLLFRPGGHGALLHNLQALQADIVFLKNVDNVVPDHLKAPTYDYKRALGGYLVTIQQRLFAYLERLAEGQLHDALLVDIATFAQQDLALQLPIDLPQRPRPEQLRVLMERLNRPMRVCGMVRNNGEPGGGPFWVEHLDGALSRQIVETSQVDGAVPEQQAILASATHFNPVDLVCGLRDFRGQPFDLQQFVDPTTGFISHKTYAGRPLKALEWPGLWNGAMAAWHTVFVEVPLATFSPVKTVFDLLRPEHQPAEG